MILPEDCCFSVPRIQFAEKFGSIHRLGKCFLLSLERENSLLRDSLAFALVRSTILICMFLNLTACNSGGGQQEPAGFGQQAPGGFEFGHEQRKIVQDPQRDRDLRENMQRVQVAAEAYASNHGSDTYPITINEEFKSYFPGGVEGKRPAPVGPVNVYTGVNEFPAVVSVSSVNAARMGSRFSLEPGKIVYAPIDNGRGYAIMGGAGDAQVLMDEKHPGQVLVLSNLD